MISADTNIFIASVSEKFPEYAAAQSFLNTYSENRDFLVCELVLVEVYMALRNAAIFQKPFSALAAVQHCESLRANSFWKIVDASPAHEIEHFSMRLLIEKHSKPLFASIFTRSNESI